MRKVNHRGGLRHFHHSARLKSRLISKACRRFGLIIFQPSLCQRRPVIERMKRLTLSQGKRNGRRLAGHLARPLTRALEPGRPTDRRIAAVESGPGCRGCVRSEPAFGAASRDAPPFWRKRGYSSRAATPRAAFTLAPAEELRIPAEDLARHLLEARSWPDPLRDRSTNGVLLR